MTKTIFYRFYLVPIFFLFVFDSVPRFFQGDSVSYLSTSIGHWLPPDRSWEFGLFVNFLLRTSHSLVSFIVFQLCILIILAEVIKKFFPQTKTGLIFWGITSCIIALDPMIEIYARFYMSDFLAMSLYIGFVVGLLVLSGTSTQKSNLLPGIALVLLCVFGCVFVRIAYILIILSTTVLTALLAYQHLSTKKRLVFSLIAICPIFAGGCVAVANHFAFEKEFPGQFFTAKISSEGLVTIFSPALTQNDFAQAGIPITTSEYEKLDLSNYQKRNNQLWGTEHNDLIQLIKDNLHIHGNYQEATNEASKRLIRRALINNPISLLKVYLYNLSMLSSSSQWDLFAQYELGLDRTLPIDFVNMVNSYSVLKITPDITTIHSPIINLCLRAFNFYPFQIWLGFLSGVWLLIKTKRKFEISLVFSAFISAVMVTPLYEAYMIPRYFLAAIFLGYVLIGLAICNFFRSSHRTS